MSEHACTPPGDPRLTTGDWTCPVCGQEWFVGTRTITVPAWERFGTGDGMFPAASVQRGGIRYRDTPDT